METQGETVLVVDDVAENVEILSEILASAYRILTALNGAGAIRIVQSDDPPDLILLDIHMPEMNGFEVAGILHDQGYDIPVIFVTGEKESDAIVKAFRIGAKDYVTKPYHPAELLARISTHLQLKRQRSQLQSMNQDLEIRVEERTRQLEQSLREKEVLLLELHHRVRNNLQILSSLLNLQLSAMGDRCMVNAMKPYLNRVQGIALAHNFIRSEKDMLVVEFRPYIRDVLISLVKAMSHSDIWIDVEGCRGAMNVNDAIPCALLVQEFVASLLESQPGKPLKFILKIGCDMDEHRIRVIVRHSGKALNPISREHSTGFRSKLIDLFTHQLNGAIDHDQAHGELTLIFKPPGIRTFNPVFD